jgi:hypothetical protein
MSGGKRMSVPKRPLKLIFLIAYLLIAVGLMLIENVTLGIRLLFCGAILILLLIAYIVITKVTE